MAWYAASRKSSGISGSGCVIARAPVWPLPLAARSVAAGERLVVLADGVADTGGALGGGDGAAEGSATGEGAAGGATATAAGRAGSSCAGGARCTVVGVACLTFAGGARCAGCAGAASAGELMRGGGGSIST